MSSKCLGSLQNKLPTPDTALPRALTTLATVYIPLSFVAGLFGMNVTTFTSDIKVPFWTYFAVALPITIASMALVWYWTWLPVLGASIMKKIGEWRAYWDRRLFSKAVSEGAIVKGLAQAGGLSAAVGRTGLANRAPNDELMNRQAFDDNIA
jgi:hypothetical protein